MPLLPPGRQRVDLAAAVAAIATIVLVLSFAVLAWNAGQARDSAGSAAPRSSAGAALLRTCAGLPTEAPRELRGMTITTVLNIDWPSRPGLGPETAKAEYRDWLDLAQRMNHNAVFVHIRPSGDAFWPSRFDPWSEWLTGRRDGQGPGWDPLAFLVAETHARNIEFHAWMNPYRGSQPAPKGAGADLNQLAPTHPLRQHPDWAVPYPVNDANSRLLYNPGIPEARRFVEDAMLDAVARYDIDGVFFDDFFYPYPAAGQDFGDDATFARYGAGFASKADWRRDNVNTMVREMSERIKALKPWVKFGISPFGIWRNSRTDPLGSPTTGLQSYDDVYADSRLWVKRQWVDYIVPQLYWEIGKPGADYAKLVPWWSDVVAGTRVQLYIAHGDYRIGEAGAWSDPAELERQLALDRKYPVSGSLHYSARDVRADKLGAVSRYRAAYFGTPALVPTMAQLPAAAPAAPAITVMQREPAGAVTLTWRAGTGPPATSFAVYRVDSAAPGGAAGPSARLVATSRSTGDGDQFWVDRNTIAGQPYAYCITGLDRVGNEGAASAPQQVS